MLPPCMAAAGVTDVSGPRASIEQCALHADSRLHGLDALRGACPGIEGAARGLGLGSLVAGDWESRVGVGALRDLGALAARYRDSAPHATPDPARLVAIAKALEPPPVPLSWWERFKSLIVRWLESDQATWPSWLRSHWSFGERFWNTFAYLLAAGIVLAAIVVAVNEVRAARGPGSRAREKAPRRYAGAAMTEDPLPDLSAIEAAPVRERAVLVLHLLIGALTRSHRLQRDRNLTCRELITAARFDSATQREQFRGLALLAEEALYGEPLPTSSVGGSAAANQADLQSVKSLYEGLLARPVAAPPARP